MQQLIVLQANNY